MGSWAQRMHRRAANIGSVVTSCGHPGPYPPYPYRLEKVKFGVPLDEVCKNDIPGPLLVLILKLNKEAPQRKDVFRAPGNQNHVKKLIHFLQAGRLINVDNYSVSTIASVLKKFLRKIPNGIFGRDGEAELFAIIELENELEQQKRIHRLFISLPVYTQRLLVLLFGTFRVIASNAERAETGMCSEALGVCVAPTFFHSCISDGKSARMEDVLRFRIATRIVKQIIDQFAAYDLFGRENYEFYARVTGRILRVQDEWIYSFRYPPPPRTKSAQQNYAVQLSLEAEKTWLQCECERWGLIAQEESQSTPALLTSSSSAIDNSALSLGIIPEHSLLESCARLSVSLEGPGVFAISSKPTGGAAGGNGNNAIKNSSSCSSTRSSQSASAASQHMTMDELRAVNRYAESTKSLSYLPQVHERQTARMRTRSEWFLGARGGSLELGTCGNYHHYFGGSTSDIEQRQTHPEITGTTMLLMLHRYHQQQQHQRHLHHQSMDTDTPGDDNKIETDVMMDTNFPPISVGNIGLSASAESVHYPVKRSSRRGPSAARHHPHRSSSRRNKENGKGATVSSGASGGNSSSSGGAANTNKTLAPSSVSSTVQKQFRSNSFRQKKSNSLINECAISAIGSSSGGKLRKPRAVSFESTTIASPTTVASVTAAASAINLQNQKQQTLSNILPHKSTNLISNIKTSNNSERIEEDSDMILMDITPPPPTIPNISSMTVTSVVQDTTKSSQLHFKPPRV